MGETGVMRPMLATRGTRVPTGEDWLHEVKWDGMRVLASVRRGRLTLTSRNENDVTVSFPDLQGLADRSVLGGHDVLLDGEIVAFLDGRPVFGALADRMHVAQPRKAQQAADRNPVTLMLFDLLSFDGLDATTLQLSDRRPTTTASCSSGRPGTRGWRGSSARSGPRATSPAAAARSG
jgi:bifunctional non-homologous end joining protein LigD